MYQSRDQELVELLTVELVVELPMIAEVGKWSGQCDTGPGVVTGLIKREDEWRLCLGQGSENGPLTRYDVPKIK